MTVKVSSQAHDAVQAIAAMAPDLLGAVQGVSQAMKTLSDPGNWNGGAQDAFVTAVYPKAAPRLEMTAALLQALPAALTAGMDAIHQADVDGSAMVGERTDAGFPIALGDGVEAMSGRLLGVNDALQALKPQIMDVLNLLNDPSQWDSQQAAPRFRATVHPEAVANLSNLCAEADALAHGLDAACKQVKAADAQAGAAVYAKSNPLLPDVPNY